MPSNLFPKNCINTSGLNASNGWFERFKRLVPTLGILPKMKKEMHSSGMHLLLCMSTGLLQFLVTIDGTVA